MPALIQKNRFLEILSKFNQQAPLVVLGDVGVDKYTHGDVRRISPEAPVPILEVQKEWEKLGLAANVSDNLQSLNVASTLCGVIGDDVRANRMENLLEERKLKTWGLVRDPERPTTYKERITTSTQQICRVDYESKKELSSDLMKRVQNRLKDFSLDHSGLIIEDYAKGFLSEELCQEAIKKFNEAKKIICVDPSRSTPPHWYKGATLLKPNRVEAELMIKLLGYHKEEKIETMAQILMDKLSLKKVIITLGAGGMALLDSAADNEVKFIPTVATEVFDVSGAGDTAISAITASLISGASLVEAAWIGNCAAGVVVKKRGTALCSQAELVAFYEELHLKMANL